MSKTLEVINRALEILNNGVSWTKESYARGSQGFEVGYSSEAAVSFCSYGAVYRAAKELGVDSYLAIDVIRRHCPSAVGLAFFNDDESTTFEDVALMFNNAIAEEEQA